MPDRSLAELLGEVITTSDPLVEVIISRQNQPEVEADLAIVDLNMRSEGHNVGVQIYEALAGTVRTIVLSYPGMPIRLIDPNDRAIIMPFTRNDLENLLN